MSGPISGTRRPASPDRPAAPFRPRDAACRFLAGADPDLAALIGRVGPLRLAVDRRTPYEALVRAVAHQQVHGRAAAAILARLAACAGGPDVPPPDRLLALPEGALRGIGFSHAKARALVGIAQAARDGIVPSLAAARRMTDAALIERLVPLRGIGRWTVEMLLIFTLGRPDVLPVDDFALREGWRRIKRLDAPPAPRALAAQGLALAPHRSAAAWYLWRASEERPP